MFGEVVTEVDVKIRNDAYLADIQICVAKIE